MRISRQVPMTALAFALLVSSCGGSARETDPTEAQADNGTHSVSSESNTAQAVEDAAPTPSGLDDAVAFWSSMGIAGGSEAERFFDLEEMAMSAHAVIVGRVIGQITGPTITDLDEPIDAEYTLVGYEVEVLELVRGSLPVGRETILLSTFLAPDTSSSAPVVMFLRWKGQGYEDGWGKAPEAIEAWDRAGYRLVSTQGLFVDTPSGVWNPISEASYGYLDEEPSKLADPVAQEARSFSFEGLLALIRTYR